MSYLFSRLLTRSPKLFINGIGRNLKLFSTAASKLDFPKPELPETNYVLISTPEKNVYHVTLNRPDCKNAINMELWKEIQLVFEYLSWCADCHAVVLSGSKNTFCSGLDLNKALPELLKITSDKNSDVGEKALSLRSLVTYCQNSVSSIEKCEKPVIASICGHCIGAGISIASAADIRLASDNAIFSIKEIDLGITADVGILNRISKQTGNDSMVREWAFTGQNFTSKEALDFGFVSKIVPTEECLENAIKLAVKIAKKSPSAIRGIKLLLNVARDHTIHDSLEYVKLWNQTFLQSEDLFRTAAALFSKR